MLRRRYRGVSRNRDRVKTDIFVLKVQVEFLFINIFQDIKYRQQCTVGQSPKGMMVFIYIGHYQGCRVLKCVQGCCRVCPWVLQNVCMVTELSNIFSNFSKIFFGAKKYFKQKVATQAKSQRGLKIIHRLVQSLWSLTQSYLVVPGGAGATKSSA